MIHSFIIYFYNGRYFSAQIQYKIGKNLRNIKAVKPGMYREEFIRFNYKQILKKKEIENLDKETFQ